MNPFWLNHIVLACPLRIECVEWNDPQLTISGSAWGFNAVIPWRLLDSEKMIIGSGNEGFEKITKELVGMEIIGCETSRTGGKVDPCFILSNGQRLEFFSICSLEPWTMKLPTPPVLVASPGDPKWSN
jgi:hypothetical protein